MPRPDKEVRITLDPSGLPIAKPDPVEIWRDDQKLKWAADFDFTIKIDGYDKIEYSKGGGAERHCKTDFFDSARKQYKYTISANGKDNDPEILVLP